MIVLDTDHVSLLLWADNPEAERLRERLRRTPVGERCTTIVTYEEQSRGWLAYVRRARTGPQLVEAYRKLNHHLKQFKTIEVLNFDSQASVEFEELLLMRLRVGPQDLKIAAICLAHDATLLSRNLRDFRRVPRLKVEDWTK